MLGTQESIWYSGLLYDFFLILVPSYRSVLDSAIEQTIEVALDLTVNESLVTDALISLYSKMRDVMDSLTKST